jgi:hypothetical protein
VFPRLLLCKELVNFEENCIKFYVKLQNKKPVLKNIYSSKKPQSCREEVDKVIDLSFVPVLILKGL